MKSDRGDFFLEVVRDVSCELDFTRLTRKMLVNLSSLVSAEYVSVYMLDASRTWSAASSINQSINESINLDFYSGLSSKKVHWRRLANVQKIPGIFLEKGWVLSHGHGQALLQSINQSGFL